MDGKFHWDIKSKVISRTSSIGCSSRNIYYCGTAEGVPFKWEKQPGTPKDPPPQEMLPPLSPPPAVLSLGLPKPCFERSNPQPRPRISLRFWRKSKKKRDNERHAQAATTDDYGNGDHVFGDHRDKLETFSFLSSDGEFMASPRDSVLSLSSSSSSSSPLSLLESLNVRNMGRVSFGRPWQINRFLTCYHC